MSKGSRRRPEDAKKLADGWARIRWPRQSAQDARRRVGKTGSVQGRDKGASVPAASCGPRQGTYSGLWCGTPKFDIVKYKVDIVLAT